MSIRIPRIAPRVVIPRIAARVVLVALCFCSALFAAPAFAQINSESETNNTESTADGPMGTGTRVTGSLSSSSEIEIKPVDIG